MKITGNHIDQAKTERGSFTFAQIKVVHEFLGYGWNGEPKKGWLKEFKRRDVPEEVWRAFYEKRSHFRAVRPADSLKRKKELCRKDNPFWKPLESDISKSKKKQRKEKQIAKYKKANKKDNFLGSEEWARLRYRVLSASDGCCSLCGRSKREHGVVLQVDHIKPRSKYPELAFDFNNLQVLCAACNWGKSDRDESDWREQEDSEMKLVMESRRALGEEC
jgi:5-methylcytosine-specific restriction endonuclease McrA